jgi:hypothetical protein
VAFYDNLTSGKSTACHSCGTRKSTPRWLVERMSAAQQRCQNPNNARWALYGGRGVEFRFTSARAAAEWVEANLGLQREQYIDRIDNDGHYEPDNLRWVTGSESIANRSTTRPKAVVALPADWKFNQFDWPMTREAVMSRLAAGMSREEILQQAEKLAARGGPRGNKIAARLHAMKYGSMTF